MSDWQERTTPSGFLQYREGSRDRWRFQVYSFRGEPATYATCLVHAANGQKRECEIDPKNRIKIDGRWYGPRHWDH
jgi:hypothetical protein